MKKTLLAAFVCLLMSAFAPVWGFFAHELINRMAVFTLPPGMIGFYKKNLRTITAMSVVPDKRRYAVKEEAPRHYLDIDHYGDSALQKIPRKWNAAVSLIGEDTLCAYGILPWHVENMFFSLKEAFLTKDPAAIIRVSAELGHYLADAHVPLHTTENYNGQLTGQEGIHGFWESRLPEIYSKDYDLFVGPATYLEKTQGAIWEVIQGSHAMVAQVLKEEKRLAAAFGEKKYSFETRGNSTVKVYSEEYSSAYHAALHGMVVKQMRASVKMIGDIWYTAWVDAGEPDLRKLIDYKPSAAELRRNREDLAHWREEQRMMGDHDH